MALNGSCFIVTRIIFKNRLLEVGPTQNHRETMPFRTLTTVDFILFYHVWGLAWINFHWNIIWLRARSHRTPHHTWASVTTLTYMMLEVCWDGLWTFSFGLSPFHGHGSRSRGWSGPNSLNMDSLSLSLSLSQVTPKVCCCLDGDCVSITWDNWY
jgi:hypothetical protein